MNPALLVFQTLELDHGYDLHRTSARQKDKKNKRWTKKARRIRRIRSISRISRISRKRRIRMIRRKKNNIRINYRTTLVTFTHVSK